MASNKSLKVLFLTNGIFVFAGSLLGPLYAVFVENFNTSVFSISLTWAVYLFSVFVFTFLISKIGDNIKEKEYLLIIGYFIRAFVWIMFVFVTNINQIMLLQIAIGLGEALGGPSFDAIFAEHLNKGEHIEEYSDWKIISNALTAIGTLIGGIVVTKFGFNFLFICMSLFAFMSGICLYLQPRKLL